MTIAMEQLPLEQFFGAGDLEDAFLAPPFGTSITCKILRNVVEARAARPVALFDHQPIRPFLLTIHFVGLAHSIARQGAAA